MTKEEFEAVINDAYWKGFEDAGRLIADMVSSKSAKSNPNPSRNGVNNDPR